MAALDWVFGGAGAQATRLRAVDWAATSIGPVEDWSPELRALVRIATCAGIPMGMMLGKDYVLVVNDAAAATLGRKPAQAVGRPYFQTWPEIKGQLGPVFDGAFLAGETFFSKDQRFESDANGRVEEKYYTSAFSRSRPAAASKACSARASR